jgi:hypothetical protein
MEVNSQKMVKFRMVQRPTVAKISGRCCRQRTKNRFAMKKIYLTCYLDVGQGCVRQVDSTLLRRTPRDTSFQRSMNYGRNL